jgi:hypothetical protein
VPVIAVVDAVVVARLASLVSFITENYSGLLAYLSPNKGGGGKPRKNINKMSDFQVKQFLKDKYGHSDVHVYKTENGAVPNSRFDIYIDKGTREILIFGKNGVGEAIHTGDYLFL